MTLFSKQSLTPTQISILITLFFVPAWLKIPDAPAPFTSTYVLGFIITWLMLVTIGLWVLLGFKGKDAILQSPLKMGWIASLFVLGIWITMSQGWAYGRSNYTGLASNAALQYWIVTGFVVVVVAHAPPIRWIMGIFILNLLIHSAIGGLQTFYQASIGLQMWGEIQLDPLRSGVSVVQTGAIRLLRPYGLLPHPNIYAGILLVGIFASGHWALQQTRLPRIIGIIIACSGFWVFLLTFSRGAWIGFGAGLLLVIGYLWRQKQLKNIIPLLISAGIVAIIFFISYQPFILTRTSLPSENTELRSISDRLVYNEIAWSAITEYPFNGVGAGNFPWYASNYLFYNTDFDLRGDNVHNLFLGIWAELGTLGLVLCLINLIWGIFIIVRQATLDRILLLACISAFAIIGLVDHYPWTLIHTQMLWFTLIAVGIHQTNDA